MVAVSASGNKQAHCRIARSKTFFRQKQPPVILSRRRRAKDLFCGMVAVSGQGRRGTGHYGANG